MSFLRDHPARKRASVHPTATGHLKPPSRRSESKRCDGDIARIIPGLGHIYKAIAYGASFCSSLLLPDRFRNFGRDRVSRMGMPDAAPYWGAVSCMSGRSDPTQKPEKRASTEEVRG